MLLAGIPHLMSLSVVRTELSAPFLVHRQSRCGLDRHKASWSVVLGSQGNLGQRRRPKHTHRSVVASFQKRNRNPTVGAMLLRWRKPEANPPFTCVNIIPE